MHPQADQVTVLQSRVSETFKNHPIRTLGMKRFSEQARQPTQQELDNKKRLQMAEDKFFNSLKTDRENRIREGKLLHYSDDM